MGVLPREGAGRKGQPSFHGVPYNLMADDPATAVDEAHLFEPHYNLHVWLYCQNPRGMFAQFNSTLPAATISRRPHTSAEAPSAAANPTPDLSGVGFITSHCRRS
jgi:hypothetical protein